jgi:hypothetical protein
MKRFGLLGALVAVWSVTACSAPMDVTVFNNMGDAIEVITDRDHGSVEPNQFDNFQLPWRNDSRVFELFRIASGGCEYLYDLDKARYPDEEWNRGVVSAGRGIQVQVEKDFGIDLLPADYTGKGPAPSEMIPKREGFPLRPFTKKCR